MQLHYIGGQGVSRAAPEVVPVFPVAAAGSVGERVQLIEHEGGLKVAAWRQNKPHPHWTGYSPDGRFALVPDLGLNQIRVYKVDTDKPALLPHGHGQSVPGGGPRHTRFSVDGRFIYLLNKLSLSVTTFAYDAAAGVSKPLTTTPALSDDTKAEEASNSASEILVHASGKFVYSAKPRQRLGNGLPVECARHLVGGGDNSPHADDFCEAVEAWNREGEAPRLRTATLADFGRALQRNLPGDLPVVCGEWPRLDYATAAMSTSRATAAFSRARTEWQSARTAAARTNAPLALPSHSP